jgi:2-methylcitrate dehydratase PrpD
MTRNRNAWITMARVTTRDGRSRMASIEYPRGRPENPMTHAELKDKFRANAIADGP